MSATSAAKTLWFKSRFQRLLLTWDHGPLPSWRLTSRQEMISLDAERGVAMKLRTAVVVTLTGIVLLTGLYYVCRTTHRI
jgi:hypothetical protein